MTAGTKTSVKAFFEAGDRPSEANFVDLIDSYVDKRGAIGQLETEASAGNVGFPMIQSAVSATVLTTAQLSGIIGAVTTAQVSGLVTDVGRSIWTTTAQVSGFVNGDIIATTAQANAGTATGVLMNPVLVKNAIAALGGGGGATTFQYLTSGSGATYTTPANCTAILVRAVGGGGGGSGGGSGSPGVGGNGGNTIFNSVNAAGGQGAPNTNSGNPGAGVTPGTGTATFRVLGNAGENGYYLSTFGSHGGSSGRGGASVFGGSGRGGYEGGSGTNGTAAGTNSGSGGSGGASGNNAGTIAGGGGQAGEYFELYISSPSASYTYTIGAGGSGGSAGTGGNAGRAGADGIIIVQEFYG